MLATAASRHNAQRHHTCHHSQLGQPWDTIMFAGVSNYELQHGAVQWYEGSVFTFKSELSQDPRWSFQHWVSVWRLSPSVPLSQQNQVYQWSIHFSLHNHRWLILLLNMGHGCSSVSADLSRLPTVGDVVLWPHHPDIAPVWPPMRDPCPQHGQCSAVQCH